MAQPDPDGSGPLSRSVTEYTLDSLGNRVAVTNPLGKTTDYERDAWFRVTASTDPDAHTTLTEFDVFGNVTEVTDPLGNVTQFTYNDLNWLVTEGKVGSSGTADRSFSYDGAGNRRNMTDRNGRITEWDYDNRYRVTTETWKQGSSTVRTLDFTYDTVDRLTALDDSDTLATDFEFAYDQRGQLIAERPSEVDSHFGVGLRQYILLQVTQNHVTQNRLLEELRERGIDISAGQISNILLQGHDDLHAEKDELLPTAREISGYLHCDDTSARHQGKPAVCTHIGNEWFASFSTTPSKSRLNFLRLLCQPVEQYRWCEEATESLAWLGAGKKLQGKMSAAGDGS